MRERLFLHAALAALAACTRPAAPMVRDASAPIQTDRLRYRAMPARDGVEFSIPFTFTNPSSDSLFIENCQTGTRVGGRDVRRVELDMELQKNERGEWKRVWGAITAACLSPPVWIGPRGSYTDTLRVFGGRPGQPVAPELEVAYLAGEYRVVWHQPRKPSPGRSYPEGDTLPRAARVSNAFLLTGGW
jgi:hypothetical protein